MRIYACCDDNGKKSVFVMYDENMPYKQGGLWHMNYDDRGMGQGHCYPSWTSVYSMLWPDEGVVVGEGYEIEVKTQRKIY